MTPIERDVLTREIAREATNADALEPLAGPLSAIPIVGTIADIFDGVAQAAQPAPPPPPPPPPRRAPMRMRAPRRPTWLYVAGAGAVALVGLGAGFLFSRK